VSHIYKEQTVGIVVLSYNEERLIDKTLAGMPDYVDKIYVVDDGSTDKSAGIVKELQNKDKRIVLSRHMVNKGPGAALVTGYKMALQDDLDIIAKMDGDNQMDPEQLPRLLDLIVNGVADYSKGNRLSKNKHKKGMSRWRRFGNFILSILTKISSGYWHVQDPQNGYTAISKNALKRINLDKVYAYYGYCNDLLTKLNVMGMRVSEVGMPARYGSEVSAIRYGAYIRKVSFLLLRNFIWRINHRLITIFANGKVEDKTATKYHV